MAERQQKRRRRRYFAKLNKERQSINLQRLKEDESLITIKQRMDDSYQHIKNQLADEYEVFISNIEFKVNSKQLVEFINNKLTSSFSLRQISVTRCQILTKALRSKGCAILLLRTKQLFDSLKSIEDTLILNDRKLSLKPGDGSSKRKRNVKKEFKIGGQKLQLGMVTLNSSLFMAKWITCDDLSLEIQGVSGKIVIYFKLEGCAYKIEHLMRNIRKLRIQQDKDSNKVVISFSVKEPPRLFSNGTAKNKDNFLGDLMIGDLMRGMQSAFLWETDVNDNEIWTRTIDPTSLGIFGHSMMYRYFLDMGSDNEVFVKLMTVLSEFSLLRGQEIKLETCLPFCLQEFIFDDHFILEQLQKFIPHRICYLLHCLAGANKFDLQGVLMNEHSVSNDTKKFVYDLLHLVDQYSELYLEEALLQCFSDPHIRFIEDLIAMLTEICEYNSEEEYFEMQRKEDSTAAIMMRRVLVTPLRTCPQPLEQESSNRVLRQFSQFTDRFLRVTFTDEDHSSILNCSSSSDIMERVRKVIHDGLFVGGRHYVFLAFSNSQIREQSCWFFYESQLPQSPLPQPPTAQYIRDSIGNFSSIRIIGKYAARMGQAFSSTIPVASVEADDMEIINDVERNGYCFSDGVGVISQTFAERVSKEKLKLNCTPSAFQIRFGGGKGMVTVLPDDFFSNNRQIYFRKSMIKFDSMHKELEINGYARTMPAFLNRQIITLFSARGIKDDVFIDFLMSMIEEFDTALTDDNAAARLLLQYGDIGRQENSSLTCAYHMLDAGISVVRDPFLQGIVRSIRSRLILDLRKKARIKISKGYCLFGVMDEFSILAEGEVFVQISEYGRENRVLSCPRVVVGRNPSLHPGDIRVLKPRDVPQLRHLVDVIVFPALGNRPHPNEMSGGDLDGDIYFVIEHESLIPTSDYAPMSYTSATIPKESDTISVTDIGNFFVDYIINDNLGQIANSHMVHADFSQNGASCNECLELAKLHSTAVDFIKTGIPAVFPANLRLFKYPHFMENVNKDKYESNKVLGKIFDICEKKISDISSHHQQLPLDEDLYTAGSELFLENASNLLREYNEELWQVMRHYGINNEFEALSGFVLSFSRRASPKGSRGGDAQQRLNSAIHSIKTRFRLIYLREIQDSVEISNSDLCDKSLIYSTRAQQIASSWYYCTYHQ